MRSIKPGRGPSAMGAMGSVAAGVFGVIWTAGAASMGAPPFFVLFGVVFIVIAIVQAIYHFKNATGTNRMSLFDITEEDQEPDPLNQRFHPREEHAKRATGPYRSDDIQYCPYCGTRADDPDFLYCPKCGKELREGR